MCGRAGVVILRKITHTTEETMRALKKISGFGLLLAIVAFAAGCNAEPTGPAKDDSERSGTCYPVSGTIICNN
jgi:hypothetical protein